MKTFPEIHHRLALFCLTGLLAAGECGAWEIISGQTNAKAASASPLMTADSAAAANRPAVSYARIPLHFEANQGQVDGAVKFLSRGRGYSLFLTPTQAVLSLTPPQSAQNSQGRARHSVRAEPGHSKDGAQRTAAPYHSEFSVPVRDSESEDTSPGPRGNADFPVGASGRLENRRYEPLRREFSRLLPVRVNPQPPSCHSAYENIRQHPTGDSIHR